MAHPLEPRRGMRGRRARVLPQHLLDNAPKLEVWPVRKSGVGDWQYLLGDGRRVWFVK